MLVVKETIVDGSSRKPEFIHSAITLTIPLKNIIYIQRNCLSVISGKNFFHFICVLS